MSEDVHCECGETFDTGDELAEHINAEGADGHAPATDAGQAIEPDDDTNTMNDTETLRDELNTILPGSEPLQNLAVVRSGLSTFEVLSARNGGATSHTVKLYEPSCTCDDWQYNTDGDRSVCAHYCAAHLHADDVSTSDVTIHDAANLIREARVLKEEAQTALESANEANVAAREAEAESYSGASDSEVSSREPEGQAAQEAAERLQDAFDEHLSDMQVQDHAGHVWFQTGQDTEDDWPYPGGDKTFKVVTDPDVVKYVHDGSDDWADSPHPLYDDKPGQYWKNALEPGDVDEYIEEVLE